MVYLYALVLVLQRGQSVVVQSNLDRTKCSTEIIALTGKNQQSELKVNEVKGLISFTFDLVIPPAEVVWSETYERPASYRGYATPYQYGLRQQFPIHQGA